MKKHLLLISLIALASCEHQSSTTASAPDFDNGRNISQEEAEQVLGPVADPNTLDTVEIRERRRPNAFNEDLMRRDGSDHRAGMTQLKDNPYE